MDVTTSDGPGCVVVSVRGRLGQQSSAHLRDMLLKAFAEQPDGVVCDVGGLPADPGVVDVVTRVADEVAVWPACPFVLCVPDPALAAALRAAGRAHPVVVVPSMEAARDAVARGDGVRRACAIFTPTLEAPGQGRAFAARWMQAWGAVTHLDAARLVVDELVANAVFHARTELEVRITLAGDRLGLAVADRGGGVPARRAPSGAEEGGRGVMLVDALTDRWGVFPRARGGKVVWAVLKDPALSRTVTLPDREAVPGGHRRPAGAGPGAFPGS
jgi:anti-sigma regulatory factor (Ser/Thr protein kinase)